MTTPDVEPRPQFPHMPEDVVLALLLEYDPVGGSTSDLKMAEFIEETHEHGPARSVSEGAFAAWKAEHPEYPPDQLVDLHAADQAAREDLAAYIGLPSVEYLPDLLAANVALFLFRATPHESWQSVRSVHGNEVEVHNGLVTLARITGKSYSFDVYNGYEFCQGTMQITGDSPYMLTDPAESYPPQSK